jgi:hypothetical protein
MAKRATHRLVAVALVLAVALLATHAVSHWHPHAYDEAHCRVCHTGQAAIPQTVAQIGVPVLLPIATLALGEELRPDLDFAGTPSIPRAPPA